MTDLSVTFQWLHADTAILRLHPAPDAKYGDQYVWWTVVSVHQNGTVELMGADQRVPRGGAKAICQALKLAGFERRFHERRENGKVRRVTKDL